MNIGNAMRPSATLVVVPKTKMGVRVQVMPRARIRTTVVVRLAPATPLEMANRMIVTRNASIPVGDWSDSGA